MASAAATMESMRRCGPRSKARPCSASSAAVGNSRSRSGAAPSTADAAADNRVRAVRAAATVICCPIIARMSSSWGSTAPGTRIPGNAATLAVSLGSAARASSIACGSASRSNSLRTRLNSVGRSCRSTALAVSCNGLPGVEGLKVTEMDALPRGSRSVRA